MTPPRVARSHITSYMFCAMGKATWRLQAQIRTRNISGDASQYSLEAVSLSSHTTQTNPHVTVGPDLYFGSKVKYSLWKQ